MNPGWKVNKKVEQTNVLSQEFFDDLHLNADPELYHFFYQKAALRKKFQSKSQSRSLCSLFP